MNVVGFETTDRRRVNQFLRFPFDLYRDTPQWVPPLAGDARRVFDRKHHPFYRHSDAAFYLAEDRGRTVGRLAVLDNANYNAHNGTHSAFFYLFESVDDLDVSGALFEAAFAWARGRGLDGIEGSRGFSVFDGFGLLVKGFEHRPAFGLPYNLPYYPRLVEAAGFASTGDSLSGYLSASAPFPERIHRMSELIQKRRGLTIQRFRSRADLRRLAPHLGELYNGAMGVSDGNVPLTADEVKSVADQMLWFADPRLIKIIAKGDRPVGFLFAYPDVSAALQRTGGRLFPLGWWTLWRELKRTKWIDINGAGILEEYRGLGGTAILFSEMQKSVVEGGYQHADLVQIGVENDKMQRELEGLGIDFYKIHRTYRRVL
jgi:GNAT superfamily N-acetyltransferase